MGGGKKCQTVGYWYAMGIHFVPCVDADALLKIRVADKIIASPNQSVSSGQVVDYYIDAGNAFGGEDKEGGVVGHIDIQRGGPALPVNPYLAQHQSPCPAYRQVFSIILKRPWLQAMNPYLKKWAFLLRRAPFGNNSHMIGDDANPARIIEELIRNEKWGLGRSNVDSSSFNSAASQLSSEGFGLSFRFSGQPILDMIKEVARHIDAVVYLDPATELYKIKLIRDDYDPASLPVFTASDIVKMHEVARPDWNTVPNNLVLEWTNVNSGRIAAVSVQDLGAVMMTGKRTKRVKFHGITRQELALTVAQREIKKLSNLPLTVDFEATQKAFTLRPGDVFKLDWPASSIEGAIMRVGEIQYSETGTVRIKAAQDIFATSDIGAAVGDVSDWQDPNQPPSDPQYVLHIESPYLFLTQVLSPAEMNALLPESSFLSTAVPREVSASFGYDLKFNFPITDRLSGFGNSPLAVFNTAVIKETQTTFDLTQASFTADMDQISTGDVLVIYDHSNGKNELCVVSGVSGTQITVDRGAYDTTLNNFPNGCRLARVDEFVSNEFTLGDNISFKFLPKTSLGTLDEGAATSHSQHMEGRQYMPCCPANFRFNGVLLATSVDGTQDLTVSFANRNRITGATIPPAVFTDGNQTPETNQNTVIQYYNLSTNTTIATNTITGGGTTDTLPQAQLPAAGQQLRIRAWAERDGEVSYQTFEHVLTIT